MSWIVVGVSAASLIASQEAAKQKRNDQAKQMQANAEAIRYSPWTGMKTSIMGQDGQGSVAAGVQGAAQGAMLGSQFKKAFASDSASKPNMMGGQTMAGGVGDTGNPYAFDPDLMKA